MDPEQWLRDQVWKEIPVEVRAYTEFVELHRRYLSRSGRKYLLLNAITLEHIVGDDKVRMLKMMEWKETDKGLIFGTISPLPPAFEPMVSLKDALRALGMARPQSESVL